MPFIDKAIGLYNSQSIRLFIFLYMYIVTIFKDIEFLVVDVLLRMIHFFASDTLVMQSVKITTKSISSNVCTYETVCEILVLSI